MPSSEVEKIKEIRAETGAGVMDVKRALEEAGGEVNQAKEILREKGIAGAAKKSDRLTEAGLVHAYIHGEGKVGVLIEVNCETDFVARTDEYQTLVHDLAMQVAAMSPQTVRELLEQEYIKDVRIKIDDLVKAVIAKTGENINIRRFTRYALGDTH